MMTDSKLTKLTKENWNEVTQTKYNLDFLNDRNAVRAVLYNLLQIDNEIKCNNIEIQNLKKAFDSQLCFLEEEVARANCNEFLDLDEKNKTVADLVKRIEETNIKFSTEAEQFQTLKEQNCRLVNENLEKLFQCKSQFKFTHQNQVESLKRFRIVCDHSIRPAVDIRLKSIDRKFCDELFYINSCEQNLKHIFKLFDDRSSRSETCVSASSTGISSDVCSEFFKDFAWMRNEQFSKREEMFNYFKENLAKDLVSALAAVHVSRPDEPIRFIANYLKHLKQNKYRVDIEERIFAAAEHGEHLFPNGTK